MILDEAEALLDPVSDIEGREGRVRRIEPDTGTAPNADPERAEDLPPLSRIAAILAIAEPTVDAALELLSA